MGGMGSGGSTMGGPLGPCAAHLPFSLPSLRSSLFPFSHSKTNVKRSKADPGAFKRVLPSEGFGTTLWEHFISSLFDCFFGGAPCQSLGACCAQRQLLRCLSWEHP